MSGVKVRSTIEFPPYRLDLRAGRLLRDERPVPLRPKTWALLHFFAERPGVLVSKDELVAGVWGDSAISDDAISRTVGELRRALEDDAREPHIIQTVHRRGFRFIAPVSDSGPIADHVPPLASGDRAENGILVDRDHELSLLESSLQLASAGHRQTVFLTGEAGAGKTCVLDAFLRSPRAGAAVRVAIGRCVELFGERDVLMPALEALEQLSGTDMRDRVVEQLRALAPSWLAQMPSLHHAADEDSNAPTPARTTPHRMRTEFAALVEALSADEPLLIVLEDLQWADHGTVDLLSVLAQRREPARLMIVGTCRLAEASVRGNAVAQIVPTLQTRHLATVIALENLTRDHVADYLRRRFGSAVDADVAPLVHERIGGHPLLMLALVDHLVTSGALVEQEQRWRLAGAPAGIAIEVPDDLRQLLENQLDLTTDVDRQLLGAASVAGTTFDSREVAAALDMGLHEVETACGRLCRAPRMLRSLGSERWPDDTVGGRYAFVQSAYQRVIYEGLAPARRAGLHQRIAERVLAAYAGSTATVASELGVHFQRSHDRRALTYLGECARQAYARHGYPEACSAIESALELLDEIPATPELAHEELGLRQLYSVVLVQFRGYGADVLRVNLRRTLALAEQTGNSVVRFDALYALAITQAHQGDLVAAGESGRELARLAQTAAMPAPWRAQYLMAVVALWTGDLRRAGQLLADVRAAFPVMEPGTRWFGVDPAIGVAGHESLRLWLVGEREAALVLQREAIAAAERLDDPFTMAYALTGGSAVCALCGRWDDVEQFAARAVALAEEHDFVRWRATALVCRGRARVERGEADAGLRDMCVGFDLLAAAKLRLGASMLRSLHAGACLRLGRQTEGLASIAEGLSLCQQTSERLFEPELRRLEGELLGKSDAS